MHGRGHFDQNNMEHQQRSFQRPKVDEVILDHHLEEVTKSHPNASPIPDYGQPPRNLEHLFEIYSASLNDSTNLRKYGIVTAYADKGYQQQHMHKNDRTTIGFVLLKPMSQVHYSVVSLWAASPQLFIVWPSYYFPLEVPSRSTIFVLMQPDNFAFMRPDNHNIVPISGPELTGPWNHSVMLEDSVAGPINGNLMQPSSVLNMHPQYVDSPMYPTHQPTPPLHYTQSVEVQPITQSMYSGQQLYTVPPPPVNRSERCHFQTVPSQQREPQLSNDSIRTQMSTAQPKTDSREHKQEDDVKSEKIIVKDKTSPTSKSNEGWTDNLFSQRRLQQLQYSTSMNEGYLQKNSNENGRSIKATKPTAIVEEDGHQSCGLTVVDELPKPQMTQKDSAKKQRKETGKMHLSQEGDVSAKRSIHSDFERNTDRVCGNGKEMHQRERYDDYKPSSSTREKTGWHHRYEDAIRRYRQETRELSAQYNAAKGERSAHGGSWQYDIGKLKDEIDEREARLETFRSVVNRLERIGDFKASRFDDEVARLNNNLRVYSLRTALKTTFDDTRRHPRVVLIVAETGSGKSTQIPQYIALDGIIPDNMRILCVVPRKLVAFSLADRVSTEMRGSGFEAVAVFQNVDLESMTIPAKVVFMPVRRVLTELSINPDLQHYGCVLIDEAHERTIDGDLCLGMIKAALARRQDLKVVIMSATMDEKIFSKYFDQFGVKRLTIKNRQYPIEIHYCMRTPMSNHVHRTVVKVVEVCDEILERKIAGDDEAVGDILAFLTSPAEVQEAVCELNELLNRKGHQANVETLVLHGKMLPAEQAQACGPCHSECLHKVIFATNIAETSLTVPGVRYVVDCGLAKVHCYNAVRRTSILKRCRISKSEAKQRAGRAGRTGPGICYRLYSEDIYERMEESPPSEITRIDLDYVVLYLLSVGIHDPHSFDFIEPPNCSSIETSRAILMSLEAIEVNDKTGRPELTPLGRKIVNIPVPPVLARMVLDSVELDILPEVAAVCACINVGAIFYFPADDERKHYADQATMRFYDPTGDPLTYLKVFSEYVKIAELDRWSWCMDNFINAKSMKIIVELARGIIKAVSLQQENRDNFRYDFNNCRIDIARKHIPSLFRNVHKRNIAIYSGVYYEGYWNIENGETLLIHPHSLSRHLGVSPEFIVYEFSLCSSRCYARNIVPVDPSWVRSVVDNEKLDALEKRRFVTFNVMMGPTAKNMLRRNISQLKNEVGMECRINGDLQMDRYHRLQILVAAGNLDALRNYIETHIQPSVEYLKNETYEFPVNNADYRIHIGPGGVPKELLLAGEYCSVFAGKGHGYFCWENNDDFLANELYPHFQQFGEVTAVMRFDKEMQARTGCACLIRFENKTVARNVIQAHIDDVNWGVSVKPGISSGKLSQAYDFQRFWIDLRWYRRKNCRRAYATLPDIRADQVTRVTNRIINARLGLQPKAILREPDSFFDCTGPSSWQNRPHQIVFQELHENVTSEELYNAILPFFREEGINVSRENVFVAFSRSYPKESERKLREYENRIWLYLKNIGERAHILPQPTTQSDDETIEQLNILETPFEVHVEPVESASDIEMFASVHFRNVEIGRRFMVAIEQHLHNHPPLSMGDVYINSARMKPVFELGFEMSERLLDSLYDDLNNLNEKLALSGSAFLKQFSSQTGRNEYIAVAAVGKDYEVVREVKNELKTLVEGITLDCRDANEMHRAGEQLNPEHYYHKLLSSSVEREWLMSGMPENVIVSVSPLKKQIKLQGALNAIHNAKRRIDEHLRNRMSAIIERNIVLRPPVYRPGLLMAVMEKGGINLQLLAEQLGQRVRLRLNPLAQMIEFQGKEEEFDKLIEWLRQLSDDLPQSEEEGNYDGSVPVCGMCMSTASADASYCLESCGHYACIECLNNQMSSAIADHNFPIKCVTCDQPFAMKDFKTLLMDGRSGETPEDFINVKALVDSAVTFFMSRNGDKYRHCITPNCLGIHEVTAEPWLHPCSLCGRVVCTQCGNEDHGTIDCKEYARLRNNVDVSVDHWLKKDPSRRRMCPNEKCGAAIEKEAGCNHMQCERCKMHFCWLCPFLHEESGPVYEHLQNVHGGTGANPNEWLEEVGDPAIRQMIFDQVAANEGQFADVAIDEVEWLNGNWLEEDWDSDDMWEDEELIFHDANEETPNNGDLEAVSSDEETAWW